VEESHGEKKNTASRRNEDNRLVEIHYRVNESNRCRKLLSADSCMRAVSEQIEVNTHWYWYYSREEGGSAATSL
jgi:uncharacterized protein YcfL